MPKTNIVDQIPRWALVLIATYGIYLMQQKFDLLEQTVKSHEKELIELRLIAARLATIAEMKGNKYDNQN